MPPNDADSDKPTRSGADANFGGVVGHTFRDSTPWWPPLENDAAGKPNVVVVLDDVGFGSLGCYGAEIDTRHTDRLAERGLRYNNFNVTPLCSSTRAALLTGRNHHSVGMAYLANVDTGYPGYRGRVAKEAGTLAETLRDGGYATLCVGKWHLAPLEQTTAAGPYDQWPLGRGFNRYYGFLDVLADQFYPDLVADNHRVDPPATPAEGYHLSEDLIDNAIGFVRDHVSIAPEQPYFLYPTFGAAHCPHQAPDAYLEKYRGRYDRGWDEVRAERFERQKSLGVIPEDACLPPSNPGVEAWDDLDPDQQRLYARMQEAYAAFIDHTDDQIGRLLDFLEAIGHLDDTVVVLLSDNGASQEGGSARRLRHRHLRGGRVLLGGVQPRALRHHRRPRLAGEPPLGLGPGGQHPAPLLQTEHLRRRGANALRGFVAGGHGAAGRRPGAVPPRHRRGPHPARCGWGGAQRQDQRRRADALPRDQHTLQL